MINPEQSKPEITFVVEQAGDAGFLARSVGDSIFTEAETFEQLREAVREAVDCHFDEEKRPQVIRLLVGQEEVLLD